MAARTASPLKTTNNRHEKKYLIINNYAVYGIDIAIIHIM